MRPTGPMLAEPLTASCLHLAAAAPRTCRTGDDGGRCDWYHGSWQFLRLLDLVSNPSWHADYFADRLPELFPGGGEVRALISGCADYSTFAHVHAALRGRVRVTALDWCPTPLVATQWYAWHVGADQPHGVLADATGYEPAQAFDLIVSDSFLPRFDDAGLARLLAAWRRSLRPGGTVVTTVRVHERGAAASGGAKPSQVEAWRAAAEAARTWWPGVCALPHPELVGRAVEFAQRQERNAVYDAADVRELLRRHGFERVQIDTKVVKGKQFARIAAS